MIVKVTQIPTGMSGFEIEERTRSVLFQAFNIQNTGQESLPILRRVSTDAGPDTRYLMPPEMPTLMPALRRESPDPEIFSPEISIEEFR
jgi:hypothetical protein